MIPIWLGVLLFVLGDMAGFTAAALLVAADRDMPPHPFIVDGEWDEHEVAEAILDEHRSARTPG